MYLGNVRRLAAVAVCLLALVVVLVVLGAEDGQRESTVSEASSEQDDQAVEQDEKPVDWKQIWLEDDRVVTVKITLFGMEAVDMQIAWKERQGLGIAGARGLVFETRDPIIADTFTHALMMPLRLAVPDEPGYGAGGGVPYPNLGYIEVFTNKEKRILIGINYAGFALGSKDIRTENAFFSWMIARQLDDILFLKTERHIPREAFRSMSGEARIEGERSNYELIRKEADQRHVP